MKLREINFEANKKILINDSNMELQFKRCNIVLVVTKEGIVVDIKKETEEKEKILENNKIYNIDLSIYAEIKIEYKYGFYEYTKIEMNDLFSHYKNEKEDIYILENSDIVFIEIKISNNKSVLFDRFYYKKEWIILYQSHMFRACCTKIK